MKIDRDELLKSGGYLGFALLLVGYIIYSVNETLTTLSKIALIAGAVFSIASLVANFSAIRGYFKRRSTKLGTNTIVMSGAVVAIIGLINFLGYRHHKRIDLTAEKLYSLSDQTRKIVSSLNRDIRVIRFGKQEDQELSDRMAEYRDLSSHLSYERIDLQANPQMKTQYKGARDGGVMVVSGSRTEHLDDIGEQAITSAILKVTRETLKKICFVEGHGEKPLTTGAEDRGENFSAVDGALKNENYETKAISLTEGREVPLECDVLVLAGPKQPLFPQEVAMIGKYLEGGGKALLLLDPETNPGLEDVLRAWGIELGNDTIVEMGAGGIFFGTGAAVPLAHAAGPHAITKDFGTASTLFPFARSVNIISGSLRDAVTTELLKTTESAFAETELKEGKAEFTKGKDKEGPITIAVAATKSVADKEARLVVMGDSDFATNAFVGKGYNGDLFLNTINWLAQDEALISIRPKSPTARKVNLTDSEQNQLFWLTLVFMPLAVLGSGVYIWWKRR